VELQNIAGLVTVNGVYVGEIQLSNLAPTLRWEDPLNSMDCEKLPGQVRMSRGDFTGNNIIGPIRLKARSTDVQLSEFTQALDLTVDRGDIDLKPGKNLPKMEVRTRSGDIDLALPVGAKFDLRASTEHGEADNDYGDPLRDQDAGHGGATLAGSTGAGPQLRLETGRGSVTVRKASGDETTTFPDIPSVPNPPKPPKPPNAPLKVEHE
jgi:hypothetical protein